MYTGTITARGSYGIALQCKYLLPCGYCELKKTICSGYCELKKTICTVDSPITTNNPITITPTWTNPQTVPTEITCSAERKEE